MRRTNGRNGKSRDLVGDMIKGAIAGAIGTWVMDRVTWEMYLTEGPKAFEQEKEAQFEGKYGAHVAADKVEEKTGMDLSRDQHDRLAKSIHYSWGMMPGAMYGALRHRIGPLGPVGRARVRTGPVPRDGRVQGPLCRRRDQQAASVSLAGPRPRAGRAPGAGCNHGQCAGHARPRGMSAPCTGT